MWLGNSNLIPIVKDMALRDDLWPEHGNALSTYSLSETGHEDLPQCPNFAY
jgi:hypothetical protein